MMKLVGLTVIAALAGCVDATSTQSSALCTAEDQEAGLCDSPAGGWSALRSRCRQTATDVEPTAAGGADVLCGTTDGRKHCILSVSTPGHWLIVNCWETTPGGDVDCAWFFG